MRRSAPTPWNVGFLERLFWDGRADSLEAQSQGPLLALNEMANTEQNLEKDLNANATYRRLFSLAFARSMSSPIDMREVGVALAAFESTLISLNSSYDRYAHGDSDALNAEEIRGLNVFRGFVGRCSQCHVLPLTSSSEMAAIGAPPTAAGPYDMGEAENTQNPPPEQRGAFKIPTLRNIACTAPYFQAGQFRTLKEVVQFYNAPRGHAVPAGIRLQIHWHLHMSTPEIPDSDVEAVVAFLRTLTDETLTPQTPHVVPSGLPVVRTSPDTCKG